MENQAVLQSDIIRKNISAIGEMQKQEENRRSLQETVAIRITSFAGSMKFVYLHMIWFGSWILLNIGLINIPRISEFDPFPFGLLTMVVSLEAIFLSTFLLIGQNQLARASERRAELDLQVNLLSEQKASKTLEMLDHFNIQLDSMVRRFSYTPDPELAALKVSPNPQEVLKVIEDAVRDETGEAMERVEEKVADVTSEMKAVHGDVEDVRELIEEVAGDVEEIKIDAERKK
jgi:uncharacterized membrane protein